MSTGKSNFYNYIKWKQKRLLHRYTPGVHLQYVQFFSRIRYMLLVYKVSYISTFSKKTQPPPLKATVAYDQLMLWFINFFLLANWYILFSNDLDSLFLNSEVSIGL